MIINAQYRMILFLLLHSFATLLSAFMLTDPISKRSSTIEHGIHQYSYQNSHRCSCGFCQFQKTATVSTLTRQTKIQSSSCLLQLVQNNNNVSKETVNALSIRPLSPTIVYKDSNITSSNSISNIILDNDEKIDKTEMLDIILIRYFYDGGSITHGRLCTIFKQYTILQTDTTTENDDCNDIHTSLENEPNCNLHYVTANEVLKALQSDGVDLSRFYATAYDMDASVAGGYLPLQFENRRHFESSIDNTSNHSNIKNDLDESTDDTTDIALRNKDHLDDKDSNINITKNKVDIRFYYSRCKTDQTQSQQQHDQHHSPAIPKHRIDIKLFPRKNKFQTYEWSQDIFHSLTTNNDTKNCPLPPNEKGYFGIGIVRAKSVENIGTLWRSAYQLGAHFIYTIGGRYEKQFSDTLKVPRRIPLWEFETWSDFVQCAPDGAVWVGVEMGGIPLQEFEHPLNAVYILGSEDQGLPTSVARSCRYIVSIDSERVESYNVAVAGSLIMYDRMMKMKTSK